MAKKPLRQWIFSVGLPEQARKDWASKQPDAVIFDALAVQGNSFSPYTDISNLLPYYWTDLLLAVDDILRGKNTNGLSKTEESYQSVFSLKNLICHPDRAYHRYKEYPLVASATSGEVLTRLTKRFQHDCVRVQANIEDGKSGLALILNDQTDKNLSIRNMLFEFHPLFQWGKDTSCEKSRNVDVNNKDEIDAVTSYVDRSLPEATRFIKLPFWAKFDDRCLQAYKGIWERGKDVTEGHSAFDAIVVPMFSEISCMGPQAIDDQRFFHSLLRHELQSLEEETIVLLMPSQLLVDRSLKSLQDINDFFTGQKFDCALFKNEFKVIIKSYEDPAVKAISMLVIEIHRTVNTDRCSRFVETSTLNLKHLNDCYASKSVNALASDDGKDSSFGACSVEANEEADESDTVNTSVLFNLTATESSKDTEDDDILPMDYASSSSQSQLRNQSFPAIMNKVLSPETWASSDSTWLEERKKLEDGGKGRKPNSRLRNDPALKPLFNFLDDKENDAFLASKREGEQLTWIEWALRCTVASNVKGVLHVTRLLLSRGKFTTDQMFPESLLMTCLKQPQPWCEVVTTLSSKFEIRPGENDDRGQTVLHLAVQRNLQLAVQKICSKSPEMRQEKDKSGKTPLDYAEELQRSLEEKRTKNKQKTGTKQAEANPAAPVGTSKGPLVQIAKIINILKEGAARSDKRHSEKQTNSDSKRRRDSEIFEDFLTK